MPEFSHLWLREAMDPKYSSTWWSCRYSSDTEVLLLGAFSSVVFPKGLEVSSSLHEWEELSLIDLLYFANCCWFSYTKGRLTVSHSNARMRKMADSDWPILYVFLLFFMKVLQNNTLFSIPNLSWSSKDREKRYDDILSVFFQRCKKIIPNFFKAYLVTEK